MMNLNQKIKYNLERLFNSSHLLIKDWDYTDYVDYQIKTNEPCFNLNTKEHGFTLDEFEIKKLEDSKKNKSISTAFYEMVQFHHDENKLRQQIEMDFNKLLVNVNSKITNPKQGLFITYDYEPKAYLTFHGKNNFEVFKEPKYFEFDYSEEFFDINYAINFSLLWQTLRAFEDIVDELDLYNEIFNDSLAHQSIYNSYKYKLFLYLNDFLNNNRDKIIANIPVISPFYVFGNEHDCEYNNLYMLE